MLALKAKVMEKDSIAKQHCPRKGHRSQLSLYLLKGLRERTWYADNTQNPARGEKPWRSRILETIVLGRLLRSLDTALLLPL